MHHQEKDWHHIDHHLCECDDKIGIELGSGLILPAFVLFFALE